MKKKRRKKAAIFLAATLMFQSGFSMLPARAESMPDLRFAAEGTKVSGISAATGQVDVSLAPALFLKKAVQFQVSLTPVTAKAGGFNNTLTIAADTIKDEKVSFKDVPQGKYQLNVEAAGFAKFSQELEVGAQGYSVKLTTGFLGGMNYAAGTAHPGVLLIGDVDGNGVIGEDDLTALVNAIDNGIVAASDLTTDLNGDGKVNLVDLEFFVKSYGGKNGESRDTKAHIEQFVPENAIQLEADQYTEVKSGNLEDMLSGRSTVLAPKNGEITKENPISVTFNFDESENVVATDGIIIETPSDNAIRDAEITVEYTENGTDYTTKIPVTKGVSYLLRGAEGVTTNRDANGNIRVHLGQQIAVKKVTIIITGMENNNNLAEISKVEFVNGMADRIPEPEMDRPENVKATAGSEQIYLEWSPCVNITGYEVQIKQGEISEKVLTSANSINIANFGGKSLKNYTEYTLCVQSINGTWESGYSETVTATPKPNGKPDKPDNVSAVGNYKSISVSWKDMKDTLSYNLYYKEKSASTYQKITGIEENKYIITDLADKVEYVLYVTGVNEFGESGPSLLASAKTTDLEAPKVPRYHLINIGNQGEKGAHIVSATRRTACAMVDSPLDTDASSAWGTVDCNPHSYYQTAGWDESGYNASTLGSDKGLTYEFDSAYKMDTIALYTLPGYDFTYVTLRYWTADGTAYTMTNGLSSGNITRGISPGSRQDVDGRSYRIIKLDTPIEAKKIQLGFGKATSSGQIRIGEIYFYYYDTLMEEIMALYADDLHTVLKANVTQDDINRLRVKINEVDEVSGEKHPELEALERELKTAEDILNDVKLKASVEVHTSITMNEKGKGFGGLNAWQPLGVTALAGETVTIYVGSDKLKTGAAANLRLVATQYHAESSAMAKSVANLKVGANIVQIPKIASFADQELGGALYIEYTGKNSADRYAVRVSGGVSVPKLDLYHVTDEAEKQKRAEAYIQELEEYVSLMEENHKRFHSESSLAYDVQNCVLGASDILMDKMMLSLPATQLLAGAGSGTTAEKTARVVTSMNGMEDMMHLFYQHKGLHVAAIDDIDRLPKSHLNIRYQRMFAGAFMYAAGNHIGIEYGSSALTGESAATFDEEGKHISGQYFGWGIAHEIGHDINQGAYAVAEITNNYFSVLAQARDTNDSVRFKYRNVYDKVTSGTKGRASNVFTQLGMYWQLHLAYDPGYNYKTYADCNEQLASLFFARVDTYARTATKAPKAASGGVDLTLSGGTDQALMRLSCVAAEKDLLEFFERWGMTPDAETIKYASQFTKENRAIYYACDDARVYAKTHSGSSLSADGTTSAVSNETASSINLNAANQVDFTLGATIPAEDVLGYEITRCMISGGKTEKQVVGFATENTFTDTIAAINNRMVWYEVSVIDKYLNRSAAKVLEPLKIEHDGSLDKTFWTVSTTGLTVEGEIEETGSTSGNIIHDSEDTAQGNDETPKSREKLIDRDLNTIYEATAGAQAEILLEFNKTLTVTGFKYTAGSGMSAGAYEIFLQDGGIWVSVASGNFVPGTEQKIYFANEAGKYVRTCEASALKLVLTGVNNVSLAELDVLGVTGDNVDFRNADNTPVIGKLTANYSFAPDNADGTKNIIPANSLVFMGMYKGNPAYNVVMLYDQDNHLVGASSAETTVTVEQIIMAPVPDTGKIENVSDGTWICWITPTELAKLELKNITEVRAELYRVNVAQTNEGQRLVSDTLFVEMPQNLPDITLEGGATAQEVMDVPSDTPAGDEGTDQTPSDTPAEDEGTDQTPSDTPAGDEGTDQTPSDTPAGDEGTDPIPPPSTPVGGEETDQTPSDTPEGDKENGEQDSNAADNGESNPQESEE